MRTPSALVALPLFAGASAGILLADFAPVRFIQASACAAVLCALASASFAADRVRLAALASIVAGSCFAGYSLGSSSFMRLTAPRLVEWCERASQDGREPVVVSGRLREDAAVLPYGIALTLDVTRVSALGGSDAEVTGGVRVVVAGSAPPPQVRAWRAGRHLRLTATLRQPTRFDNPGIGDERRTLALRGIALTGSVKSAALVEVVDRASWFEERAAEARQWTRGTLQRHVGVHDARSAAVAIAILIGDRSALSEEDERRLQDAGTYHVVAISGGNIAILTTLLIAVARLLRAPPRTAAATTLIILGFYAEIAGGSPSVQRAVTAAAVFLAALILDHRGSPSNVFAVAALLAIALRPETAIDGGFLLSFGATGGILLGVRRLPGPLSRATGGRLRRGWSRIVVGVLGLAAATLSAEAVLLPIAATLFSRVTAAGLLLNFAAIPLMTLVQCGSLALLAVAPLSPAGAGGLGAVVHWSAWGLVESASVVDAIPWAVRDVTPPAAWWCALYYAALAALLVLERWRRLSLAALLLSGGVIVFDAAPPAGSAPPARRPGVLRLVVLDVGQGDATAAVLPDGRALLIDAGGLAGTSYDIGGRVLVPSLRALRVRELHALVLTHGDPDHVGGADAVLRRLRVANVWEGNPVPPHPVLRALGALAGARRAVWRTVRPDDVERAAGVEIRVHHPPLPDWERQRVRNDDSVVLEVRYGDVSVVLPGDISAAVERALIPRLERAPLTVLKAAHHGSATSSSEAFVDALSPSVAIFSAGRGNRFGHPAPVVVQRFATRGVAMFNTATDGAVFVETDGKTLEVWGWMGGRRIRLPSGR